jgi:predicted nucleotidyltransferase
MRLTPGDITIIRSMVRTRMGPTTGIWLFGSRLDDSARGGDIDLYVEPGEQIAGNLFLVRERLRRDLERQLRQPVDLVINPGSATAFMRQARNEGRPL